MKNEDLSYKIRELTKTSDEGDLDWDPDKFWNLYVARKRKRQRWIVLAYSMAAMVSFAVAYIVFTADKTNHYSNTNSRITIIPKGKKIVPLLKSEVSAVVNANSKSNKPLANHTRVFAKKSSKLLHHGSYGTNHFIERNIPVSDEEDDELPSLLQMFEEAQREREMRTLSVQLEDQTNYNGFWLTVNQHLLANRLNTDQLHYERY